MHYPFSSAVVELIVGIAHIYSSATAVSTPKPLHAISDLAANFFAKYQAKSKNQAKLCASSMKTSAANDQPSNSSSTSAGNSSHAERSSSKPLVSSVNTSSKSSVAVASSQLQAAEKRLLQMKKKAAMKTTYKSLP
ncbi:hypothetical protein D918_10150 [Trichuris suis]|nr:hypothetical protein D918_10150 [Trichuris suis]